jgi:eukaryotic-like serine/threonine-protein kinase
MDLRDQLQSTLGHAYQIDRELSGGAMSRVFVARDTALGRDVVIKLLSPDLAGSLSTERFRREIELSARLQHPNIVPLLTAADADGLPFYTMPLVAGESLRARLERDAPLPVHQALSFLRDVARALAYAHHEQQRLLVAARDLVDVDRNAPRQLERDDGPRERPRVGRCP